MSIAKKIHCAASKVERRKLRRKITPMQTKIKVIAPMTSAQIKILLLRLRRMLMRRHGRAADRLERSGISWSIHDLDCIVEELRKKKL